MFEAVSPGIRDRAMLAMMYGKRPAEMFAEFEDLAGPTAIEDIAVLIRGGQFDPAAWENGRARLVNSLPEAMRPQAKAAIESANAALVASDPQHRQALAERLEELRDYVGEDAVDRYLQGEDIF